MSNHTSGIRAAKMLLASILAVTSLVVAIMMITRPGVEIGEGSTEDRLSASGGDAPGKRTNDGELAQKPRRTLTPIDKAAVYDPQAPLSRQLDGLRRLSDRGNPYATCVLAFALDMCASSAERTTVGDLSQMASADPDEVSVDRWAVDLEFRERFATTCAGLDADSFADMEKRLLISAKNGHPKSMAKFALASLLLNPEAADKNSTFAISHRNSAELMLNRAAERGDLSALRGVHSAYSQGYITSAFGEQPVVKDLAKSVAALYAISRYASGDERRIMELEVDSLKSSMSPSEKSRFQRLSAQYSGTAKRSEARARHEERLTDEYPEVACGNL